MEKEKDEEYEGPIVNCIHGEVEPISYEEIEKFRERSLRYVKAREAKRQKEMAKSKSK